jgi:hypothetical protein
MVNENQTTSPRESVLVDGQIFDLSSGHAGIRKLAKQDPDQPDLRKESGKESDSLQPAQRKHIGKHMKKPRPEIGRRGNGR